MSIYQGKVRQVDYLPEDLTLPPVLPEIPTNVEIARESGQHGAAGQIDQGVSGPSDVGVSAEWSDDVICKDCSPFLETM